MRQTRFIPGECRTQGDGNRRSSVEMNKHSSKRTYYTKCLHIQHNDNDNNNNNNIGQQNNNMIFLSPVFFINEL